VITLDTMHLNRVQSINPVTRTATFEAGIYGPELERHLQAAGFTLGHFPQSFHFSTLGGWIAARSAGQFSDRYGKAEDFLAHAQMISPAGTWSTSEAPASAAGPDLNGVVAGSEGTMGVITEATVHIHPAPPVEKTYMFLFRHVAEGVHAVRQLRQDEQLPLAMLRLSDAEETRFLMRFRSGGTSLGKTLFKAALGLRGYTDRPALLLVGLTGAPGSVRRGTRRVMRHCRQAGGAFAGPRADWRSGHYAMPYLRDDLMDRGIGVDTVETATTWDNVLHLHQAVRRAAARHATDAGYSCATLAHISHSYPDGASLYFTFLFPMDLGHEIGQWRALKRAVSDTIVSYGGTISHHHGVGRDHQPWMERELDEPARSAIRAIQQQLDPHGTCNPGKLVG
jgi:alkyldihydroxyacetonephosphate synthase